MSLITTRVSLGSESLAGPWLRYPYPELGFQIPVTFGWRITPVENGVVFAMQRAPDPYVRVAVGRIKAATGSVENLVLQRFGQLQEATRTRTECLVDGRRAIMIEGFDAEGFVRDVFVTKENDVYWIGFAAENNNRWADYSKTFDIVMEGFQFV